MIKRAHNGDFRGLSRIVRTFKLPRSCSCFSSSSSSLLSYPSSKDHHLLSRLPIFTLIPYREAFSSYYLESLSLASFSRKVVKILPQFCSSRIDLTLFDCTTLTLCVIPLLEEPREERGTPEESGFFTPSTSNISLGGGVQHFLGT